MPPRSEGHTNQAIQPRPRGERSPIPIRSRGNSSHPFTAMNGYPNNSTIQTEELLDGIAVCACGCGCIDCHCSGRGVDGSVDGIDLEHIEDREMMLVQLRRMMVFGSIDTVNHSFPAQDSVPPESAALWPGALEDPFAHHAQQVRHGLGDQQEDDEDAVDEDPQRYFLSSDEEDNYSPMEQSDFEYESGMDWSVEGLADTSANPSMLSSQYSNHFSRPSVTQSVILSNVGGVAEPRNTFLRLL